MQTLQNNALALILISNGLVVLGFLIQGIASHFFGETKANSKAAAEFNVAIAELKVEVRNLRECLQGLPKLKEDVDAAHGKIRVLETWVTAKP